MFVRTGVLQRTHSLMSTEELRSVLLESLDGEKALFLMGNLTELHRRTIENDKVSADASKSAAGSPSPQTCLAESLIILVDHSRQYIRDKASNLVTYHPVFKWYSGKSLPGSQECFPDVIRQLSHLWNRTFIADMFSGLLAFEPSPPRAPSSNTASRLFQSASRKASSNSEVLTLLAVDLRAKCRLYLGLAGTVLAHRLAIMNGLSYTSGLIPGLWRAMNEMGPHKDGGLGLFLTAAAGTDPEKEPLMPILELFCEAACSLFITLDNNEIYERQHPFRSEELTSLLIFLNQFCFRLYWNHGVPRAASSSSSRSVPSPIALTGLPRVLDPARRLLTLLYDRSSRRAFGEEAESTWLAKEVGRATFIEDVRKGDARALLILGNMPQCVPFKSRVEIFRMLIEKDKAILGGHSVGVKVHRSRVLEDGYRQLGNMPPHQLKQTIRVKFINEFGLEEAGIDQSGVFKEFLEDLCKQSFSPSLNLFSTTPDGNVIPSPTSFVQEDHLHLFEFIGRILGKALYEGIVIDIPFALFVYAKFLGRYNFLDELPSLDPELYKSLTFLKHYDGDCEDLGLTFTIDQDLFGKVVTKDIKPGGSAISVTNENKYEYIHLMADHRLNKECKDQFRALIKGFRSIISERWLGFFSPVELQKLMSGEYVEFDANDLRQHVRYEGGYFDQHKTIRAFWQVLDSMSAKEKTLFLKFVTSCSNPPVGGFQHLHPPFTIRYVPADEDPSSQQSPTPLTLGARALGSMLGLGKDAERLPTASTCFNMLKLPAYKKKSTLKEKLLYAIKSGAGFELS
ncbi:Ubiquitin-protein ligase E3B [Borealophlyctis nickersoniae]|nr:Ubiquitin-protein ligase E3B [Borealophlyctis nickersoniae]